jgi:uncharacterized membrane protein YkvA (DUF1232 family)
MKRLFQRIGRELNYYRALLKHPRTPRISRWLIAVAIAYFISPIDLIPDGIPILGQLDDLIIVPTLIYIALAFIPAEVKSKCRQQTEIDVKQRLSEQ